MLWKGEDLRKQKKKKTPLSQLIGKTCLATEGKQLGKERSNGTVQQN